MIVFSLLGYLLDMKWVMVLGVLISFGFIWLRIIFIEHVFDTTRIAKEKAIQLMAEKAGMVPVPYPPIIMKKQNTEDEIMKKSEVEKLVDENFKKTAVKKISEEEKRKIMLEIGLEPSSPIIEKEDKDMIRLLELRSDLSQIKQERLSVENHLKSLNEEGERLKKEIQEILERL
jgi:hypothetical protein